MKKHAYLIMVHDNFEQVKKLIALLDNKNNDIYLHIDKKSKFKDFESIKSCLKYSNIVIKKEIKVYWAEFSQVECEILLLKEALNNGKYDYYHLLSGHDLPLLCQKDIHEFFEKNKGKEFVQFSDNIIPDYAIDWINYYHPFIKLYKNKYIIIRKIGRYLSKISINCQKKLKINRMRVNNDIVFLKGANWFSITSNLANYIVEREKWIFKTFKYTQSPDEIFLQTLLYNSPYKNNLYLKKYNDDYRTCMRYIDWKRGKPYTFTEDDYYELINSGFIFARKFNEEVDNNIINNIYLTVESENKYISSSITRRSIRVE